MDSAKRFTSVDEYLSALPEDIKRILMHLRGIVKEIVPDAEELISYQIPSYKHNGMLVGYAAFKKHCSFYLMHGSLLKQFIQELNGFNTTQSAIHFTPEHPIPDELIKRMIRAKLELNAFLVTSKNIKNKK
ncbi:iron chaperone [Mucilaginibacter segetis]|uniref:DUF1801 domain-containing protein n=1 Tax=Mucilaginibacter segetis TaxID=2793071 RepID=A0A934UP47_9SPHI|nr:DUF1801 domain-containing protein [Mucilaginibacter segetis]MBK0381054.1 DUF1801 domain-containing protein [Mucilaginibacter segetis]